MRVVLFIFLALFMILTFYAIFNTGNPNSLFRFIVRDPSYDIIITVCLAVAVFILVILLTAGRSDNRLKHLLEINTDHILELKTKGKTDEAIAESFLKNLGAQKGIFYSLAKRRVLRYLLKIE